MANSFQNAIKYLLGKGVIERAGRDIAAKTGYDKSTVSSYTTGRITPSEEFVKVFEQAYKLNLKDFDKGGGKEVLKHPDALQLLSENILLLKAEAQTNRQLIVEVLANVSKRSVMEVSAVAETQLSHNLTKIVHELKREQV